MPKNPKSRPKIKSHVCTPYPFKLKSQAYPKCRICGRAMKVLPPPRTDVPVATPETKRICDEILQIFIQSEKRGKVVVRRQ